MRKVSLWTLTLIFIVGGSAVLFLWARKTITLTENGVERSLVTYALTPSQFLDVAGITLRTGDRLFPEDINFLSDGDQLILERASQFIIRSDRTFQVLLTPERIPANLLAMAGIRLYPGDRLLADGRVVDPDEPLEFAPAHSLQIRRAVTVRLESGEQTLNLISSAGTLGEALWEAGIILYAGDRLSPPAETSLDGPMKSVLIRSRLLRIQFQEGELKFRSAASTVGDALVEVAFALEGLDYSVPSASSPLPGDGSIRVVRVQETVTLETEPLPFETKTEPQPNVELDQQVIVDPGVFGLTARRIRVRFEDGVEVWRQVEAEYVAQEPQPRILGYGTKIVPNSIDTPAGRLKYWRALNMYAVSYNPTSAGGNITASGLPLAKGIVAVDPNYIPLGTRLYIPGYGEALAADTGGGVKGRIIDLGYSDSDYVSWHQWVTVYFLWPPPENIVWVIP